MMELKTSDFNKHELAIIGYKGNQKSGIYSCQRGENLGRTSCHSGIRYHPEYVKSYAGLYAYDVTGAPELFDYLTSLEGPYRQLMETCQEGWYWFGKEKPQGFTMPDKASEYKRYPLLYSFLICTRIPHEKPGQSESFLELSKRCDPNLAFLLSKYLTWDKKTSRFYRNSSCWTGSHEAFIDVGTSLIDVKRFCAGDYIVPPAVGSAASSLFRLSSTKSTLSMDKFVFTAYGSKEKTGFTYTKYIHDDQLDKMLEDFKGFLELRYK